MSRLEGKTPQRDGSVALGEASFSVFAGQTLWGTDGFRSLKAENIHFMFCSRNEKQGYQLRVKMGKNYWKFLETKGKGMEGYLVIEQTLANLQKESHGQHFGLAGPSLFIAITHCTLVAGKQLLTLCKYKSVSVSQGNLGHTLFSRSDLAAGPLFATLMQAKRQMEGLVSDYWRAQISNLRPANRIEYLLPAN